MATDKLRTMNILIDLDITNGWLEKVRDPLYDKLVKGLIEKSNGAIMPCSPIWPHMNCHFGAVRLFGFSIQLQIPIIVNKTDLVRQKAGCWTPIAVHLVKSQKIADTLQSELYFSIDKEFSNASVFASCIVALRAVRVEVLGKC
jgi:hypothetical protein